MKSNLLLEFCVCRSSSDDDTPSVPAQTGINVMFSTPVSSLKAPRNALLKLKRTQFQLPSSVERHRKINASIDSTASMRHVSFFAAC